MEALQILALAAAAVFCKGLSVLAQRTAGRAAAATGQQTADTQTMAPTSANPSVATAAAVSA